MLGLRRKFCRRFLTWRHIEIDENIFLKEIVKVSGYYIISGFLVVFVEEKQVFHYPRSKKTADTIVQIIRQRIKFGTKIISDEWIFYASLCQYDYTHLTVILGQVLLIRLNEAKTKRSRAYGAKAITKIRFNLKLIAQC